MAHATVSGSIMVVQDDEGTRFSGESYVHQAGLRLSRDFFEAGASLTLRRTAFIRVDAVMKMMLWMIGWMIGCPQFVEKSNLIWVIEWLSMRQCQ